MTTTTTTSPPPPPENIPPLMPVQVLSVAETASTGPTGAFVKRPTATARAGSPSPWSAEPPVRHRLGSGELRLLDGAALDAETAESYLVVVTARWRGHDDDTAHGGHCSRRGPCRCSPDRHRPGERAHRRDGRPRAATDPEGEPLTWTILDTRRRLPSTRRAASR